MTNSRKLLDIVGDDIRQDQAAYTRLRELLQAQFESLLRRDSERIGQHNQEIMALVEASASRAQRRSKILGAFRLDPDKAGMQRLLGAYPQPRRGELERAWAAVGELADECKRLNERNGKLLASQHEILSHLLGGSGGDVYVPQPY